MIQQLQLSELKRHAMTGVSYMLPLVVASGLLIAIGNICGNNPPVISDYKSPYTLWQAAVTLGVYGMGLIPAVMSAAISYSIADRPGIAPGLLMGMIANSMGAGFFGGMLGGYMAGWCVNFLKKVVKVPVWAQALMPMLILPLLASLIVGFIMFFLLGGPIAAASFALTDMLQKCKVVLKLFSVLSWELWQLLTLEDLLIKLLHYLLTAYYYKEFMVQKQLKSVPL